MTFWQIRLIKRMLLLLLVTSSSYVGYQLWRGVSTREKEAGPRPEPGQAGVSREVQLEQLDSEGRTAWTLKAAESTGRTETSQKFRDVEIRFDAGKPGTGGSERVPVVVTAERCEIANDNSVYLEGNVVVHDDTTLELHASTLRFERRPDRIWTRDPVRYSREGLSGTAGDMRYELDSGLLELGQPVAMTLEEKGGAPVAIESLSAKMRQELHMIRFVDSVHVRQANRALDCDDLQVYLDEKNQEVERLEAYENVDLRMSVRDGEQQGEGESAHAPEPAGATSPAPASARASLTSEPGTKRLLTDRFEAYLRPGGKYLDRARALEGGRLLVNLPKGATEGLEKVLEGYTLAFEFDEEGRLVTLRGRGGVTLTLTPVAGGQEKKTITARQLEADFDPVSGELGEARCEQAVTFEQGSVRAAAEKGTFRSADSRLVLEDQPRLWNEKASLEAREIRIQVDSGNVQGIGDVHSKSVGAEGNMSFPGGGDAPVFFLSQSLLYEKAKDLAAYTGSARAIQGRNRIEADRIDVFQEKGDLSADGQVRTVFFQRVRPDKETPDAPAPAPTTASAPMTMTTTDAERLDYRSAESVLHYRGEVAMRSDDMTLHGDAIDVSLSGGDGSDGSGASDVSEVLAKGNVTIQTADGKANGDNAKYLPKDGSMTVTGEAASLENAGKLTEGKQLTFFLGDDKVFVDGRELTRTKTTYSSKPRL
jgi:LPS export ABC transporter protein LptC